MYTKDSFFFNYNGMIYTKPIELEHREKLSDMQQMKGNPSIHIEKRHRSHL